MSNPQGPDDPFAPKPEHPAQGPAAPGTPGQPAAPGYGQPAAPGYGQPSYGQPAGDVPVAPPYGQQPPAASPYPSAPQYPSAPSYGAEPQYGQYGGQPYGFVYPKNQLGVWALVLGIASLVLCGFIAGIPAIILGRQGQRAADEGQANNRSVATAGLVLGWVGVALSIAGIIFAIIFASVAGTSNFWHTNP